MSACHETEARKNKAWRCEVTRYGLDDLDRAIADGTAHGFVKVLTVPGKDRILGVTIVGEHAGDLLAEYVLAMKHGLGLNKILGTIHTYPDFGPKPTNTWPANGSAPMRPSKLLRLGREKFHAWELRMSLSRRTVLAALAAAALPVHAAGFRRHSHAAWTSLAEKACVGDRRRARHRRSATPCWSHKTAAGC